MQLEPYDAARASIAAGGLSEARETAISSLICAAKGLNANFLGAILCAPLSGLVQDLMYLQWCEELSAIGLLQRATRWRLLPSLTTTITDIMAPVRQQSAAALLHCSIGEERGCFEGLALGHALLSKIRLTPVLPRNVNASNQFIAALRHVETNNARLLQTQIRLLAVAPFQLKRDEKEAIGVEIAELVQCAFEEFLGMLAEMTGH